MHRVHYSEVLFQLFCGPVACCVQPGGVFSGQHTWIYTDTSLLYLTAGLLCEHNCSRFKPRVKCVSYPLPQVDGGEIIKFTFVLVEPQAPLRSVQLQCEGCQQWHQVTLPMDIKGYEDARLKDEDYAYTCPECRDRLEETGRKTEEVVSVEERDADMGEKRLRQEGKGERKNGRKSEGTRGRLNSEGGGGGGEKGVSEGDDSRGQSHQRGETDCVCDTSLLQRQHGRRQTRLVEDDQLELGRRRGRGRPRRTKNVIKTGTPL